MYKKWIEQHTKNKAGLLWFTPFILSSKRQRQVDLLELETGLVYLGSEFLGCCRKTPVPNKTYTHWTKQTNKKKTKRKKEKEREIERMKIYLSFLLVFLGSGFWNKVCFWFIRLGGVLIFVRPPWTQQTDGFRCCPVYNKAGRVQLSCCFKIKSS